MKKITIHLGSTVIDISTNKIKYLIGDNYSLKYDIIRSFRHAFSSDDNSEYSEESGVDIAVYIDDKEIERRKTRLVEVNIHNELEQELKLRTNSVFAEYLTHKLNNIEYSDEFSTLRVIYSDFERYLEERINDKLKWFEIGIKLTDLNLKSLIKMMNIQVLKNSLTVNLSDLSYDDVIEMQLIMIDEIGKKAHTNAYVVLVDLPVLTERIKASLELIEAENITVLVITPNASPDSLEDVMLVYKNLYDLANLNVVYERLSLHLPFSIGYEDVMETIREFLCGKQTSKTSQLRELL